MPPVRNHTAIFTLHFSNNSTPNNSVGKTGKGLCGSVSLGSKRQRGRGFAKAVRGALFFVLVAWGAAYVLAFLAWVTDFVLWMEAMS